jgi:hypothetical protein
LSRHKKNIKSHPPAELPWKHIKMAVKVCFKTPSATSSTQPGPPVSSCIIVSLITLSQRTQSIPSLTQQSARFCCFSAPSTALSVHLHGPPSKWTSSPLSLTRCQCAKARHANHHPWHFDATLPASAYHQTLRHAKAWNRRI